MILTRNICSICKNENFADDAYNIENQICNECNSKLYGQDPIQITYSIQPKKSSFEKFILGSKLNNIYILKVKTINKEEVIPPFTLFGSQLNFPSNSKNAKII